MASPEDQPYVGLIHDFSYSTKGFVEVRTVWFTHPDNVLPKSKRREDALKVSMSVIVENLANWTRGNCTLQWTRTRTNWRR